MKINENLLEHNGAFLNKATKGALKNKQILTGAFKVNWSVESTVNYWCLSTLNHMVLRSYLTQTTKNDPAFQNTGAF